MVFSDEVKRLYLVARKAAVAGDAEGAAKGLAALADLYKKQHSSISESAANKARLKASFEKFSSYAKYIKQRGLTPQMLAFFAIEAQAEPTISTLQENNTVKNEKHSDDSSQEKSCKDDTCGDDTCEEKSREEDTCEKKSCGEDSSEESDAEDIGKSASEENSGGFSVDSLDAFIGQTEVTGQLKDAICYARMMGRKCIANKGGVLFLGNKGLGKTTLMWLTAKSMGIKKENFFYIEAAMLRNDAKSQKILDARLHEFALKGATEPVVLCMDEIHRLNEAQQSMLLTLLESRKYVSQTEAGTVEIPIREFTFIGATTDEQDLLDTVYNRFEKGLIAKLVDYTKDELDKIIRQKVASYTEYVVDITAEAVEEIIARCRSSIREIESYVDKSHQKAALKNRQTIGKEITDEVFASLKIDKTGFNAKDLEILHALNDAPNKTLSEENIANKVHISLPIFQNMHKPYLIRRGFIVSTGKGQALTTQALEYLSD